MAPVSFLPAGFPVSLPMVRLGSPLLEALRKVLECAFTTPADARVRCAGRISLRLLFHCCETLSRCTHKVGNSDVGSHFGDALRVVIVSLDTGHEPADLLTDCGRMRLPERPLVLRRMCSIR